MLEGQALVVVSSYAGAIVLNFDGIQSLVLETDLWQSQLQLVAKRASCEYPPTYSGGSSINTVFDELFGH